MKEAEIIIGIDAGTSVIKAVAFDLAGKQINVASVPNRYVNGRDGSATQSMSNTWLDCALALRQLGEKVDHLTMRTVAISVTAQGDGTWLVGRDNKPVADAWIWLDARASRTVERLAAKTENRARFEATGTGLNTCQQGVQMAHMDRTERDLLDRAEVALHCKDWLYLNLTGMRVTDPSEASFTFGNFRTRTYDEVAIAALELTHRSALLPEIIDGTMIMHPLTDEAARHTGLLAGTPVSLGYVDMVMTALGAGVYGGPANVACSILGSTGVHMRATTATSAHLNVEGTGYIITLPVPNMVTQVQTNMAATLNLDWVLGIASDVLMDLGQDVTPGTLVSRIDKWMGSSRPGTMIYSPYISEAGERGPFVNANARASFVGLSALHHYADLVRAVVEGLGLAMRDCYCAMGDLPEGLRLTGGASRSAALRGVLSASINAPVSVSSRSEAGAAGAAMMAAVAIGVYPNMDSCVAEWVSPLMSAPEQPDSALAATYAALYPVFSTTRRNLAPVWEELAALRNERDQTHAPAKSQGK